jgi:CelD/BcsL family acetyltransferase involved in cellulose biosynthesis
MTTVFNPPLAETTPGVSAPVMAYAFEAHQGLAGFQAIAAQWQALALALGADCAFQHRPEWYLSFLESGACEPDGVWFVTAKSGSSLLAVVPLQYQNYRIGPFAPRLLGTIDDDQMQLSDFVFAKTPAHADLMLQLIAWLRSQRALKWDGLRLRKVRENSAIAYSASHGLPSTSQVLRHDASNYFDTSASFEHATRSMTGDFRRNVRRQLRRAEEDHAVRIESVCAPDDINRAFQHFLAIEASGWKGDTGQGSAIYCQPALLNFYQALVTHFGARGECVINLLWFGPDAIAAQFGLKIGRTLHILKFGYAEAFSRFAPGNLLLLRMVQLACEDAQTDTLSLVNDPPWSRRFGPTSMDVLSYFVPNKTLVGRLNLLGLIGKRAWENWRQGRKPSPK